MVKRQVNNFFRYLGFFALTLIVVLLFTPVHGQVIIPGTFHSFDHGIQRLSDSTLYLPTNDAVSYDSVKDQSLEISNPTFISTYNSGYPRSFNDGPVWRGKGLTQEIHAGMQGRLGLLYLTLHPVLFFSQNQSYDLVELNDFKNKYNYQFRPMSGSGANIDYVQRYGNSGFFRFHPGQTDISLRTKRVSLGASTQNFTIGPGQQNHLLMSNTSGGFPHVYLKTSRPVSMKIKSTKLGKFSGSMFFGLLNESAYFDDNEDNNQRNIQGISLGYQFPYLEGFSIGFSKVLYKDTQYWEAQDLYALFHIDDDGLVVDGSGDTLFNTGNDTFDQLASFHIQYHFKKEGARIYFEFGKNDFNGDIRRRIVEFEHNRMYSLGLEKLWQIDSRKLYVSYEHTYLAFFKNYIYRPTSSAYSHSVNKQGYTNDGQLLGAGIGPGSVSDYLRISLLESTQFIDFTFQRIRFDEDYFISQLPNVRSKMDRHDIEFTFGASYGCQISDFSLLIKTEYSYRYNMYFEENNDRFNFLTQLMIQRLLR